MRRPMAFLPFVLLVGSLIAARAAQVYEVTVERNVAVRMRDGVVLRADIYRPKTEGKLPNLLTRTPYNKAIYPVDFALRAAARVYVFILQDCRAATLRRGSGSPSSMNRTTATTPSNGQRRGLIRTVRWGCMELLTSASRRC
jgi:hypothetical protein